MQLCLLASFLDVLKSIGGVLLALLLFLVMITVHEFGHYIVGKKLHFQINEFSIGFGPALFKRRNKKTGELFAVRLVPLGGYCAFEGETDDEQPTPQPTEPNVTVAEPIFTEFTQAQSEEKTDEPVLEKAEKVDETPKSDGAGIATTGKRFNEQPPWKRILVLLAGATMNYLFAILLIVVMFSTVGRVQYQVMTPPQESQVQYVSVLQEGDRIEKIDGKTPYLITDYIDALNGKKAGDEVTFTVLRGDETIDVALVLSTDATFVNSADTGALLRYLGVYGLSSVTVRQNFFASIGQSFAYSVKIGGVVLRSLGELLTGKIGLEGVGGPITMISTTAQAASYGVASFLNMASLIGVNLAVFNLLPIPALDGCKIVFCIIEWIRKKPINRKVELVVDLVGIVFLFSFAIMVDLLHFF